MTPSVEYPSIQIDGFTYHLKFGPGAQLRLERMGYSMKQIMDSYTWEERADGTKAAKECKVPLTILFITIAACAGSVKSGTKWKPITLTAEEIADTSTQEDVVAMSRAVGEMWSKAQPEQNNPATVPASQPDTPKAN